MPVVAAVVEWTQLSTSANFDPTEPPGGRVDDPKEPPGGRVDKPKEPPGGRVDDPPEPPGGRVGTEVDFFPLRLSSPRFL